jgi:hypothetical protein
MRCRMSIHAHSIYLCIYTGHKKLRLYLSAEWCLAPDAAVRSLFPDEWKAKVQINSKSKYSPLSTLAPKPNRRIGHLLDPPING